jgi:hypothetical protein
MKIEGPGQTAHRTGPALDASCQLWKTLWLVALFVTSHGHIRHNFKGKLGQTHNEWAPTSPRCRYKSKGWPPSCVRTYHKPRPPTRPLLAFHPTVVMFSSYPQIPHYTTTYQDRATLPPLQQTTYPIYNAYIRGAQVQPSPAGSNSAYMVSLSQPT